MHKFFTLFILLFGISQVADAQVASCRKTITTYPFIEDFNDWDICSGLCGQKCDLLERDPDDNGFYNTTPLPDESWRVFDGRTFSLLTGPRGDVTGGGRYLYAESSGDCGDTTYTLITPCFQIPEGECFEFSFFYHMFGIAQNTFKVDAVYRVEKIDPVSGTPFVADTIVTVFSKEGSQGPDWLQANITIDIPENAIDNTVFYKFVASVGSAYSDVAIDEIYLGEPRSAAFAECQDATVYLDKFGRGRLLPETVVTDSTLSQICYNNTALSYVSRLSGSGNAFSDFNRIDCDNLGVHRGTARVNTTDGRTATCSFNVEVLDTVSPVLKCFDASVILNDDNGGYATLTSNNIVQSLTDNCSDNSVLQSNLFISKTEFSCSDLEEFPNGVPVSVDVEDGSGNESSCEVTVSIIIQNTPTVTCQNRVNPIALDNQGKYFVNPADFQFDSDASNTYPCPSQLSVIASPAVFTCSQIGAQQSVRFIVIDAQGNRFSSPSCTFELVDLTPPKPECDFGTFTITLDENGLGNVREQLDAILDPSTSDLDNCSLDPTKTRYNPEFFTCSDINTAAFATVFLEDESGNKNFCNVNVIVEDTSAPTLVTKGASVEVRLQGQSQYILQPKDIVDLNLTEDNCTIDKVVISDPVIDCSTMTKTVEVYAIDIYGNKSDVQDVRVNVIDEIAPLAICRDTVILALDNTGSATLFPNNIDSASFDNCGLKPLQIVDLMIGGAPSNSIDYDCDRVGINNVQLVVTDNNDNTSACIAKVKVVDTVQPIIVCLPIPVDVTVDESGVVDLLNNNTIDDYFNRNLSFDNCGFDNVSVNLSENSLNCRGALNGLSNVTVIATDPAGNTTECTAAVNVIDNIAPKILCPNGSDPDAPTVAWAPGALNPDVTYIDQNGLAEIDINLYSKYVVDNCEVTELFIDNPVRDCIDYSSAENDFGAGTESVEFTINAVDAYGNISTETCFTRIVDEVKPTALCKKPFEIQLDNSGNATLTFVNLFSLIDKGSADNCPTLLQAATPGGETDSLEIIVNGVEYSPSTPTITPLSCADVGTVFNATLTIRDNAKDEAGNQVPNEATCATSFTLVEKVKPIISGCPTDPIQIPLASDILGGTIEYTDSAIVDSFISAFVASDNCDTVYIVNDTNRFDYTDLFKQLAIDIVVSDTNGNTATCPIIVEVIDTTMPLLTPAATTPVSKLIGTDTFLVGDLLTTSTNQFDDFDNGGDGISENTDNADGQSPMRSNTTLTAKLNGEPILFFLNNSFVTDVALHDENLLVAEGAKFIFDCDPYPFLPGINIIEFTATDLSGNVATIEVEVENSDKTAAITCAPDSTVYIDSSGVASVGILDIIDPALIQSNGLLDSLAIDESQCFDLSIVNNKFDCSDIGVPQNVTLSILDAAGNTAQCVTVITVEDTILPMFDTLSVIDSADYCVGENIQLQIPTIFDPNGCENIGALKAQLDSIFRIDSLGNRIMTSADSITDPNKQTPGFYELKWKIFYKSTNMMYPNTDSLTYYLTIGQTVTLVDVRNLETGSSLYITDSDQLIINCDGSINPLLLDQDGEIVSQADYYLYNFEWSTGDSTANLSGLCPGTYTLTVSSGSCEESVRSYRVFWTFFGLAGSLNLSGADLDFLENLYARIYGKTGMSKEEFIQMLNEGGIGLADVYPNPTSDFINFDLVNPGQQRVTITVIDIIGANAVYQESIEYMDIYEGRIDMSRFANGHYLIQFSNESGVVTRKIVKR